MSSKTVRRYLTGVRRALPWDGSQAPLMEKAAAMVEEYIQENPAAQPGDLQAAFGPAGDFAAEMVGPEGVARAKKQRRLAIGGCVAAALLVLAVVATVFFVRWRELRAIIPDDEYIVIEPAKTLTPEEFEELFNDPNITWEGD